MIYKVALFCKHLILNYIKQNCRKILLLFRVKIGCK